MDNECEWMHEEGFSHGRKTYMYVFCLPFRHHHVLIFVAFISRHLILHAMNVEMIALFAEREYKMIY